MSNTSSSGAPCTCELHGWCDVCDRPNELTPSETRACAWCGVTYPVNEMFRVGRTVDGKWVCGSDCPSRPERNKPTHYQATLTIVVHATTYREALTQVSQARSEMRKHTKHAVKESKPKPVLYGPLH